MNSTRGNWKPIRLDRNTSARKTILETATRRRSGHPRDGISVAQSLTVADIERSARYYEKVFDAQVLGLGDGNAPGYLQLAIFG
jgi:hypothetical protein